MCMIHKFSRDRSYMEKAWSASGNSKCVSKGFLSFVLRWRLFIRFWRSFKASPSFSVSLFSHTHIPLRFNNGILYQWHFLSWQYWEKGAKNDLQIKCHVLLYSCTAVLQERSTFQSVPETGLKAPNPALRVVGDSLHLQLLQPNPAPHIQASNASSTL